MSTTTLTRSPSSDPRPSDSIRCSCGRLVGRIVAGTAHTKCQRCKREVSLAFTGDELRCPCRRLLARRLHGEVELKCPRCKGAVLVP